MQSFKDFLTEGKEEATQIRNALKKAYGLTNRDVAVKSRTGGTSSAVNVDIKSMKALELYTSIENIASEKQYYDRDEVSGEILAGGNTFVFVAIDYKFKKHLDDIIQKEFDKVVGSVSPNTGAKMFKVFNVNMSSGGYWLSAKGSTGMYEIRDNKYVGTSLIHFIINKLKEPKLFKHIK